ncbi:MAG: hypothetical protein LBC18_12555, partial [Opitutaceae bacterium]|nr:hypothetical protein [Opitutaceae bacterium]
DERSEEPTESIKKKTSPEGAAAREGRGNAMTRTARAAAPSGLGFPLTFSVGSSLRSSPTAKG